MSMVMWLIFYIDFFLCSWRNKVLRCDIKTSFSHGNTEQRPHGSFYLRFLLFDSMFDRCHVCKSRQRAGRAVIMTATCFYCRQYCEGSFRKV